MGISELKKATEGLGRRVKRLETQWGTQYLRSLTAAEYAYLCDENDIYRLVCLALCDEDGNATEAFSTPKVGVKKESVDWLKSAACPAELLHTLSTEAQKHCFPDFEEALEDAEGNSGETQSSES